MDGASVVVGEVAAEGVDVVSDTTIRFIVPALVGRNYGPAQLTVINPHGLSSMIPCAQPRGRIH